MNCASPGPLFLSWVVALAGFALASAAPAAAAVPPIAITEVHSAETTNGAVQLKADWWELTNFGASPVDLSGARFNDSTGGLSTGAITIGSLVVAAGESVIFVEQSASTGTPSAADFASWWGPALPGSLRVFTYSTNGIGLGSAGDSVLLWSPGATDERRDLLAQVDFPAATAGFTFLYDPATGLFGTTAAAQMPGVITAVEGADVGSPGATSGPIPLSVAQAPSPVSANPGDTALFTVVAHGMPRPRYQWQRDGVDLPGANAASLTVSNVNAALVGDYRVLLDNGLGSLASAAARLSIKEQPTPPAFSLFPTNLSVLKGGTATFSSAATGVPQPSFQWSLNGTPIADATGAVLVVTNVTEAQAGTYRVTASNASGSVAATATLTVRGKPNIRITEVHSASTETVDPDFARRLGTTLARAECECGTPTPDRVQALSFPMEDWFELTSFESQPLSLKGWRFDDSSARIASAYTITNDIVISPGESMVLTERLTPAQFRAWWGANELPASLQIVTYTGSGLGLSSGGDALRIWDADTTSDANTVAAVDFPAGDPGVSFNFDPGTLEFGALSVAGVNGVYQAPGSIDAELSVTYKNLGSPGRIRAGDVPPPAPRLGVGISGNGGLTVSLPVVAGHTYELQSRADAASGAWSAVGNPLTPSAHGTGTFEVPAVAGGSSSFYRVAVH